VPYSPTITLKRCTCGYHRHSFGQSFKDPGLATLLSINNYYYYRGGADSLFLEHNQLFSDCGWSVIPFAMTHPKNLQTPWSKYFVDEIEFGERYSFAQQLSRAAKVIYSLEAKRKLTGLLRVARPDVCHAHNIYHHISPSILGTLKSHGIPVVLTLHDLKIACPAYNMLASDGICERCKGGRLYNVVTHRCIKGSIALSAVVMIEAVLHSLLGSYRNCVSRFVVPSKFYISKLQEWGLPASMFTHVPNFVRAEEFAPQYDPGTAFLYFGRVSREKGLATLIRAAAAVGCRLMVAGTGTELDNLRQLASQCGTEVDFLGYLTGERLHAAIRSARAVVIPSEWYENAPMSVLEAYALGKPVIAARIGGIPELLREDETGTSFESGSVEGLTDALREMISRPDSQIEKMGKSARRWVESEFNASLYRERISVVYRDLNVPVPAAPPTAATA
jgi:glycosyltransferase involved in cell wall biosynthesis